MKMRRLIALPLLALTATAALAQDGNEMCRNGLFPNDSRFALAEVNGQDRAYFHADTKGCPWTGTACSGPAYVLPGATVIISKIRKGFACTFQPGSGGGTAGWMPAKRLNLLPVNSNPPLSAWLGRWSSEGNPVLTFADKLGRLYVSGQSFWPGPPGSTDWPSIHEGSIAGEVRRKGHLGDYADDDLCEVKFTLLGDFLIAGDNGKCGGANVSFSAVYSRKAN